MAMKMTLNLSGMITKGGKQTQLSITDLPDQLGRLAHRFTLNLTSFRDKLTSGVGSDEVLVVPGGDLALNVR